MDLGLSDDLAGVNHVRLPALQGRVVVTGVCGFIGSHLAEALLGRGDAEVTGVDRLPFGSDPRTAAAVREMQARPGFRLLSADASDRQVARCLPGARAVVHLAAPTDVGASWGEGFADQAASLLGTQRLLDACRAAQVPRVVLASSGHVYGPVEGDAREDMAVAPASPYAVTKLACERLAVAYARRPGSAMSVIALRFFTAFGPRSKPAMVVPRMFRSALTGEPLPLHGDGTAAHTWTHVDDLVRAVLLAIGLPLDPGAAEVVNAAGADRASLRQAARVIEEITGRPVAWTPAAPRPGDAEGVRADLSRARQVLGFSPEVGLRDGMERMWHSLQKPGDPQPAVVPPPGPTWAGAAARGQQQ